MEQCEYVDEENLLDLGANVEEEDVDRYNKIVIDSQKEWTNKKSVPVKEIKCFIPYCLLKTIRRLEKLVNSKFNQSNEFSIFIHGDFNDDGNIVVSEEYYIPKQVVTPANIDIKEDPTEFSNGCLHKHPHGCKFFSGADTKYVNANFEFSLLYVDNEIRMGIVNIKYGNNTRLQVPLKIVIMEDCLDDEINIDNIVKKEQVIEHTNQNINLPDVIEHPTVAMPEFMFED